MKLLKQALLALMFCSNVHGAVVPFFAHDGNGNKEPNGAVVPLGEHPNADGAFSSFKSSARGKEKEIETFESFSVNDKPDFTIGGGTVNATVSLKKNKGVAVIETNKTKSFGRDPTSGTKYLQVESNTVLEIKSTSGPLTGIGFYATDIGDTKGKMTKIFTKKSGVSGRKRYKVPITPQEAANNGGVSFIGIYDEDGFDELMIGNRKGSAFGIDDLVLVSNETSWMPSCPDGLAQVTVPADTDICGTTLATNTQYTFTQDIVCPSSLGVVMADNSCIDGKGFTLTPAAGYIGVRMSGVTSTVIDLKVVSTVDCIQVYNPAEAYIHHTELECGSVAINSYSKTTSSFDVKCSKITSATTGVDSSSFSTVINGLEITGASSVGLIWRTATTNTASCVKATGSGSSRGFYDSNAASVDITDSVVTNFDWGLSPYGTTLAMTLTDVTSCGNNDNVVGTLGTSTNLMCDGEDIGVCDFACSGEPYSLPSSCEDLCPVYGLWTA